MLLLLQRLSEVAHSLLKVSPYDPDTMSCKGLQRYMTEVLPYADWANEAMRPALIQLVRRLDKTFSKIHKKASIRVRRGTREKRGMGGQSSNGEAYGSALFLPAASHRLGGCGRPATGRVRGHVPLQVYRAHGQPQGPYQHVPGKGFSRLREPRLDAVRTAGDRTSFLLFTLEQTNLWPCRPCPCRA